MITYFDNDKPLRRPLSRPRRQPRRQGGKNGAVDMRKLDGVLQDLGFAPKPHPTIFIENEPEAVFDGLEKFQKSNGLTVDGAVQNKDSETGTALNKAMAEFYNPEERDSGGIQEAQGPTRPTLPTQPKDPAIGSAPTPGQIPLPTTIERQLRRRGLDLDAIRRMTPGQQRRILGMTDAEFEKWRRRQL